MRRIRSQRVRRIAFVAALVGLVAAGCSPELGVPPHLVASWPVDGARLAVRRQSFELTFNRPLSANESRASVRARDGDGVLTTTTNVDASDASRLDVHVLEPTRGDFDLYWHAVAADSHLASEGKQSFSLENESPSPPRIDVSPGMAESGDVLELVGKGFSRDSDVQLMIGDVGVPLAATRTDASGKFNFEAHVPAAIPLGVQPVTAADAEGHTAVTSVAVHWGGWPPIVAYDVGEPGPAVGQVTFTLAVRNLSDYVLEHVRVVMKDPEAASLVGFDAGAQRRDGELEWDIPVMDRGSYGPFRATYRADAPLVSHAWLEFRHRQERGCASGACLPAFISSTTAESAAVTPR